MKPFLQSVAEVYFAQTDIQKQVFIFPNRRSLVFFRKYLSECISAETMTEPIYAPEMLTINDFFYRVNNINPTDRITLLITLYEIYKKHNLKAEPLDEFIFWGDIILGDFNDIDKYLVDPKQLFANIEDLKSIQDTYSYLTENQRQAIETFVSHFNDSNGRLTADISGVKGKFLHIWNILYPIYKDFREVLNSQDQAYEGMVYRTLADRLKSESIKETLEEMFPHSENFVFIGLNALNECEKALMRKMQDEGIADFVWDYFSDMIKDGSNKSSFFLSDNVKNFPAKYDVSPLEKKVPEINVLSVPSSVGQAKQLPEILKKIGRITNAGTDCAIVLADEKLLVPVLNSIPPQIQDINVTMGYPMTSSSFFVLMQEIAKLQLSIRKSGDNNLFYHKQLYSIISNNIFKKFLGDKLMDITTLIKSGAKVYITEAEFQEQPLISLIFKSIVKDKKSTKPEDLDKFIQYLMEVVSVLAKSIKDDENLAIELEFAREYYTCLVRLRAMKLAILPQTFISLMAQLLNGQNIPFKGEPLKGLQIMGPLETRALDFDNIIILSTNEGIFPRRSVSSSFVPPELRKAFVLPTYEYQDAVWAYYFYRLLQRSKNLWLVYDSRTEGTNIGEESRYIKQLRYHYQCKLNEYVSQTMVQTSEVDGTIQKTEEDVAKIKNVIFSASTLRAYLDCPLQFYYMKVKDLKAEQKVSESLDAGMIGNVFHKTMQDLYALPTDGKITLDFLNAAIKDKAGLKKRVGDNIIQEIKSTEVSGRNLVLQDVILKYVLKTLDEDRKSIIEKGKTHFTILGLEGLFVDRFEGYKFVGYIDRLDSFEEDQVRVVDYKTGMVLPTDVEINDDSADIIAEMVFAKGAKERPKIALQFFIYDLLLRQSKEYADKKIVNSVFSTASIFTERPKEIPLNETFYNLMKEGLKGLLEEISDINVPFTQVQDEAKCRWCDFKIICGR